MFLLMDMIQAEINDQYQRCSVDFLFICWVIPTEKEIIHKAGSGEESGIKAFESHFNTVHTTICHSVLSDLTPKVAVEVEPALLTARMIRPWITIRHGEEVIGTEFQTWHAHFTRVLTMVQSILESLEVGTMVMYRRPNIIAALNSTLSQRVIIIN